MMKPAKYWQYYHTMSKPERHIFGAKSKIKPTFVRTELKTPSQSVLSNFHKLSTTFLSLANLLDSVLFLPMIEHICKWGVSPARYSNRFCAQRDLCFHGLHLWWGCRALPSHLSNFFQCLIFQICKNGIECGRTWKKQLKKSVLGTEALAVGLILRGVNMTGAPTSLGRPNTQQLKMQSSNISLQPKDPCKCAANTSIVMDGPFCKGSCVKPRPVPIPARLTSRSCRSCCGCRSSLPTWPTSFCTDLHRSAQIWPVWPDPKQCCRCCSGSVPSLETKEPRPHYATSPCKLHSFWLGSNSLNCTPRFIHVSLSLYIYIYCLKHVQI